MKFRRVLARSWPTTIAALVVCVIAGGVVGTVIHSNHANQSNVADARGVTPGSATPRNGTTISIGVSPPHSGPAFFIKGPSVTVSLDANQDVETVQGGQMGFDIQLAGKIGNTVGPIHIAISNAESNPHAYHETYPATQSDTDLGDEKGATSVTHKHVSIPVPKQSGAYLIKVSTSVQPNTTSALPNTTKPLQSSNGHSIESQLTVYINHGGFYRHTNIIRKQRLTAGHLTVDVTAIKMTPTHSEIEFTANTSSADLEVFQNITGPDGKLQVVPLPLLGTIITAQKVPEWDVYASPVESKADSLTIKFKTDATVNNQLPALTDPVTIPLPKNGIS